MSNGHLHQKTTENYIAVTSKNAPRSLSTRSARLQEVQATELLPEKNSGVWIDGRLCLSWFLKSGGRTWIDMEFRGGVKLRIINFAKTVTCTFWFLLFQPFPSKTRAYFISFQHISFTATVFRLRKANVYVDDCIIWWIPQKTAKHFDTSPVNLICKK